MIEATKGKIKSSFCVRNLENRIYVCNISGKARFILLILSLYSNCLPALLGYCRIWNMAFTALHIFAEL